MDDEIGERLLERRYAFQIDSNRNYQDTKIKEIGACKPPLSQHIVLFIEAHSPIIISGAIRPEIGMRRRRVGEYPRPSGLIPSTSIKNVFLI